MMPYALLDTKGNPAAVLRSLFRELLTRDLVDLMLVAGPTPFSALPMPMLFSDPEKMDRIDPLAPVSPFNAARQVAAIARHETGKRIAVVLRPCEIRALIELAKLKQCALDDLIIIGIECLGRMENDVFLRHLEKRADLTSAFYEDKRLQEDITRICKTCEHFQPRGADVVVSLLGASTTKHLGLLAETDRGKNLLSGLGLSGGAVPGERDKAAAALRHKRIQARDALFAETSERIGSIEGLQNLLAHCLNCHNCRVACPVCYCRECVFVTDVFAHEPEVLIRRATKKGAIKIPTETTMFHLTRLVHISHACVGCGQCSSVCPSHIPVADIFKTVAARTQSAFDYEPGRDVSEPIPYLVFKEKA